jgi:RHS repeat-associated protein
VEHGKGGEGSQTGAATPVALFADLDTASPKLYYVASDHLSRPVMMTDDTKAIVWQATFLPFGAVHTITGSAANDNRFPGQYYQLESGLNYNWHRQYDPSLGRYTQPDPLGLIDGPSRYAYAKNSPLVYTDPKGLAVYYKCRAAEIALGLVEHCWLETDTKSGGMGGNPDISPGQEYEYLGSKVQINDHSKDKATRSTLMINTDEQCVNKELEIGKPLGTFFPPFNDCQSFARGVMSRCRIKRRTIVGPQL